LHEEDVVINDGFKSLSEEVGEVVKVFDAHALQELHIANEDGGTGSLVNYSKPEQNHHNVENTPRIRIFIFSSFSSFSNFCISHQVFRHCRIFLLCSNELANIQKYEKA